MSTSDPRFNVPLYTVAEAGRHLGIAPSTIRYWIDEKGIVTSLPAERGDASLPFVALAEIQFIRGLRKSGMRLHAVVDGVQAVRAALGAGYLQKDRLAHNGVDILVRLAETDPQWTRARDSQSGIPGIIDLGLQAIDFDDKGLPQRVKLEQYEGADIYVDPRFAFGQPMVDSRGVRIEDIAGMFFAGDPISTVAEEFGVDEPVVEAIVRNYGRPRAA